MVLNHYLPLLSGPGGEEKLQYERAVRACAAIADTLLTTLWHEEEIRALRADESACLVALLHRTCASRDVTRREAIARWKGGALKELITEAYTKATDFNLRVADGFVRDVCKGRAQTGRVYEWATRAVLKWDTFDWRVSP